MAKSKLTPYAQYIRLRDKAIRSLRNGGWKISEIAELFRMDKASISRISRYKQANVREGLRQRRPPRELRLEA